MSIAMSAFDAASPPPPPLHVAYSCDTDSVPSRANVFSAAKIDRIGHDGCAKCPGTDVASCFTPPSAVWAQLKALPEGGRSISLEGFSPYYCEPENATTGHDWYWMDKLSDGATDSPWGDVWAKEVRRRFELWFGEYAKLGGTVDQILSDFEMGGHAYWYAFAHQKPSSGGGKRAKPQDLLGQDSRWPALRHRLNEAGAMWNASFDDLSDMQSWSLHDARASVWDRVIVDEMVAENLNASVYEPIAKRFPHVKFSNFAHAHHTDPTGQAGPLPSHECLGWPYETTSAKTPLGTGSHVGTHQSISIYGKPNTTTIFARSTGSRVRMTAASPFDALLLNMAKLRDMHLAAPHVPVQPWLSPKYATWNAAPQPPTYSWISSSDGVNDRGDFWQEQILHAALSTGAKEFLWWKPGANRPMSLGLPLLSAVLSELDLAVATAGGALPAGNCTSATPLVDATTALDAADASYLLSGATLVGCSGGIGDGGGTRRIYRLTPRCLDGRYCTQRPAGLLRPQTRATLKLFSGFEVAPVADGCWWAPTSNTSSAGFWIVAPC